MRGFSLLFLVIAAVVLVQFVIYIVRGPVDPIIATGIFISFLACAIPALYLLKPYEGRERLEERRREFRRRRESEQRNDSGGDSTESGR